MPIDKVISCNARVVEIKPENNTGRPLTGKEPGDKVLLIEWHHKTSFNAFWPPGSGGLEGKYRTGIVLGTKQEVLTLAELITEAANQMPD